MTDIAWYEAVNGPLIRHPPALKLSYPVFHVANGFLPGLVSINTGTLVFVMGGGLVVRSAPLYLWANISLLTDQFPCGTNAPESPT